jgi:hypothetical protein
LQPDGAESEPMGGLRQQLENLEPHAGDHGPAGHDIAHAGPLSPGHQVSIIEEAFVRDEFRYFFRLQFGTSVAISDTAPTEGDVA